MKRLALTICMIALLVGVAFAGMAASGQNNGVPAYIVSLDEKVSSIQGTVAGLDKNVSSIQGTVAGLDKNVTILAQGNTTMMQTLSGAKTGWLESNKPFLDLSYDGIRHFHVSCNQGASVIPVPNPGVQIEGAIQTGDGNWVRIHYFSSQDFTFTDEFDASRIIMRVENQEPVYETIVYAITMTYPIQP